MRTRILSALFVTVGVTAVMAMTVPAAAAGAEKTTYLAVECYGRQTGGTIRFSGKDGKIFKTFESGEDKEFTHEEVEAAVKMALKGK